MNPTTETITCRNEWDEPVTVSLIRGTREKGIGYCQGEPTLVYGGVTQQAPAPDDRWRWADADGTQFRVTRCEGRDAYWVETGTTQPGGGVLIV